jgi:hypothetical protein
MNEMNLLPVKPSCLVCGKPISDGWDHVLTQEKGWPFLVTKDKPHAAYFKKVEASNYKLPCFCGGHIMWSGSGEDSYEVVCDTCGFMFDED